MAVKVLLILHKGDKSWLAKSQKVSHDRLYCVVVCESTITKYVMIRNATGMNHLKFPDALTSSTVLARLCTSTFRPLHVTQLSNPCGVWEVGMRDEIFVYRRWCSKMGLLWRLVVSRWAGQLTARRQKGEDASTLKSYCIVCFSLTHVPFQHRVMIWNHLRCTASHCC